MLTNNSCRIDACLISNYIHDIPLPPPLTHTPSDPYLFDSIEDPWTP